MNDQRVNELEKIITTKYTNIAGIVALKKGAVYYEKYFNQCVATSRLHVYSVAKSIISVLIGIAIDKGLIKSINQKVLEFFPDYVVRKREKTLQKVTLKDMLTMTAPYKYKFSPYTYIRYFMSDDKAKFSLDLLGGKGKIGDFKYTPLVGPDILSAILVKVTGKSVLDFATENLFTPLGINVEGNVVLHNAKEQSAFNKATTISGWVVDNVGTNSGGWGLTLSAFDMAKIGQLYLNNGMWGDKQIVSREWLNETTKVHSQWEKNNLKYGFLWWIIDGKEGIYSAMGDGGNVIYVNTEKEIVVSIASLYKPKVEDRIEFIKEYIEPLLIDVD